MTVEISFITIVSMISGLLAFHPGLKGKLKVTGFLSFSGAYLLSICILHLLPDFFKDNDSSFSIYILLGFFMQLILDYFSGGIEHGHTHVHAKKVGKFPFLIIISLCIHSFLEALPINHLEDHHFHSSYYLGILIHKAPIAFVFSALLMAYNLSRVTIIMLLVIFSLSAPLGIWLGIYLDGYANLFNAFYAISIGIILHLSTTILFETNEEHKIEWKRVTPILLGLIFAILGLLIH